MKIPPNGIDTLHGGQSVAAGKNERAGPADGKPAAASQTAGQQVGKTDAFSSTIKALRAKVAADDPIDHAKVERVSKAIADGTFKVNAEAVADKMLQGAADMFAPKQ